MNTIAGIQVHQFEYLADQYDIGLSISPNHTAWIQDCNNLYLWIITTVVVLLLHVRYSLQIVAAASLRGGDITIYCLSVFPGLLLYSTEFQQFLPAGCLLACAWGEAAGKNALSRTDLK